LKWEIFEFIESFEYIKANFDGFIKSRIIPFLDSRPSLRRGRLCARMTIRQLISDRYHRSHTREGGYPVFQKNILALLRMEDMSQVIVAATQMQCSSDRDRNMAEADRSTETIITAELNLDNFKADRSEWGFFRDRRPEMYRALMTLDGDTDQ